MMFIIDETIAFQDKWVMYAHKLCTMVGVGHTIEEAIQDFYLSVSASISAMANCDPTIAPGFFRELPYLRSLAEIPSRDRIRGRRSTVYADGRQEQEEFEGTCDHCHQAKPEYEWTHQGPGEQPITKHFCAPCTGKMRKYIA